MTQQKALVLLAPKGEWTVVDRPVPQPGAGDLLVKIQSTALNPVDWKVQGFAQPLSSEYPVVLGTDASGTVEALGEGVTGFKKGDSVFFQGFHQNDKATFQQYAIVPAEITAHLPKNVSFDEAASVPSGLATGVLGLFGKHEAGVEKLSPPWEDGIGKYAGRPIAVFGGSSSVGQYTIQLAKLAGFTPIITTASLHNTDQLKSIGATHIVDRKSDVRSAIAQILSSTRAGPLNVVYDAISDTETQAAAWDVLVPGGQLVLVHGDAVDPSKYPDKHLVHVYGMVHVPENRPAGVKLYAKLTEWFENGILKPNRVELLPDGLKGIVGGLKRLENNEVSGLKLIARPQETA